MSERFYIGEPITTQEVTLLGPEAHHLLHVVRAKPGQEVTLFDGTGKEFTARILGCDRREVRLSVESSHAVSRESRIAVSLGVALPKGDRQRWLVEKAVELGVATLVPMITSRSVARPTDSALDRLRRAVVEASKQCGRTRLMQISRPQTCHEFFTEPDEGAKCGSVRICAHVESEDRIALPSAAVERVQLAVGPEGGFTDEEISTARDAGWSIASLGPRILRVETAAIALAAIFTLSATEAADSEGPNQSPSDGPRS